MVGWGTESLPSGITFTQFRHMHLHICMADSGENSAGREYKARVASSKHTRGFRKGGDFIGLYLAGSFGSIVLLGHYLTQLGIPLILTAFISPK